MLCLKTIPASATAGNRGRLGRGEHFASPGYRATRFSKMQSDQSQSRLFLAPAPEVHFCESDGTFVFLDSRTNRYTCLRPDQADMFRRILDVRGYCDNLDARSLSYARFLIEARLLIEQPVYSPRLQAFSSPLPTSSLLDDTHSPVAGALRAIPAMAQSILAARRIVRKADMLSSQAAVLKWRERASLHSSAHKAQVAKATLAFHALTPLFFTAHDACLFRSLALIRFLALHGVSADWVFGVCYCPFLAHCWIELDGVVLNDFLDNVSAYRPILRIPGDF